MPLSANNFEIALETVPESTIIESTTISGARCSRPRCATSMPPRVFFNSTALMLEEPTSRPTIDFAPNPNMCPPLRGSLSGRLRFPALQFRLAGLLFHPLVQLRFLKAPTVPQLESRNLLLVDVLVERVRTYAQVLRRLANIHNFARICHSYLVPQRFVSDMPTHAGRCWERIRSNNCFKWISVNRAYINLESDEVRVQFRVFWAFLRVLWKSARTYLHTSSISCGKHQSNAYA